MHATTARPDAAPAHPVAFTGSPAAAAEQTAANAAQASAATSTRPPSLLTPAVTRVIDWHQQRLTARHGRTAV